MNRIFLGPAVHWLVLSLIVVLGWLGGRLKLHVKDFNLFTITVVVVSVVVLLVILLTAKRGKRITRDPLTDSGSSELRGK